MKKAVTLLRHAVAITALPFTVTVLIPIWIARSAEPAAGVSTGIVFAARVAGVLVFAVGLALFAASLHHFATRGQGTLAPWDPPKNLVVSGPYRYVRNPMISGVIFVLFGEAMLLVSWAHARWAAAFLLINLVYIPLLEEPLLIDRFGEAYREYRRHVWMFLPRLRPWTPPRR